MEKELKFEELAELSKKTHVVLVHESLRESISRDISTAGIFLLLWSIGYFVGSAALEWIGIAIGGFITVSSALRYFRGNLKNRMTPAQAREWLDREFPED
jgi:hypothetical protein